MGQIVPNAGRKVWIQSTDLIRRHEVFNNSTSKICFKVWVCNTPLFLLGNHTAKVGVDFPPFFLDLTLQIQKRNFYSMPSVSFWIKNIRPNVSCTAFLMQRVTWIKTWLKIWEWALSQKDRHLYVRKAFILFCQSHCFSDEVSLPKDFQAFTER